MKRRTALLIAGATGLLGVALGAFGAHVLTQLFKLNQTLSIWNTAVIYHLIHTPVLLWLAGRMRVMALPVILFASGTLIFSGSLYALAITNIRWLGAITPIGGMLLLAGWSWIAFFAYKAESPED
jgi:uncharacterized membrane protein YgdD (TMEM256/DUF423 family)